MLRIISFAMEYKTAKEQKTKLDDIKTVVSLIYL